jgi:tetratricopeptide (TPR) repeat protein
MFGGEMPADVHQGKDAAGRRRDLWYLAGATAFLTLLVYLPTLQNKFIELDDAAYIRDNPYIRSFNLDLVRWAFFRFYAANWHPLTWISHALDYALWGMNPLGHHLTSIIIHAINTFLVVLLSAQLLRSVRKRALSGPSSWFLNDRSILIAAGITGLLFGIHPVHVESAAWVAERKDLLCALFFLLSLMMYVKYGDGQQTAGSVRVLKDRERFLDGESGKEGQKRSFFDKYYLLALGFYIFALMSKPMAVSLPVVLLILDWFPGTRIRDGRSAWDALAEKLPFVVLALGSSVLTVLAQKAGGALVTTQLVPLSERLLVGGRSLMGYLGMMLFPRHLVPYYPYPALSEISVFHVKYFLPLLLIFGVTATCIRTARNQRIWLAVWAYYVITLLPVLGIVQVGGQAMADRYTYLPSLGPFLLAGLGGAFVYSRAFTRSWPPRVVMGVSFSVGIAGVLLLSAATVRQIGIWKDSMVVFNEILANESRPSPMVVFHRGVAYERAGNMEKAIDDYSHAIELFPPYYEAFFGRGTAYERVGRLDLALSDYSKAISLRPDSYEAYTNRGLVNKKLDRRREAFSDLEQAVELDRAAGKAYLNLGILYTEEGSYARAIESFSHAIDADPLDAEAYGNRGIARAIIGQVSPAMKDLDRAIELRPDFAVIYYNRGRLFAESGRWERAVADFQKACQLGDETSCQTLRRKQAS